jgi:hypothetical protein
LTMKADESAVYAVLFLAWQGAGLRNRRFHRPSWSKLTYKPQSEEGLVRKAL